MGAINDTVPLCTAQIYTPSHHIVHCNILSTKTYTSKFGLGRIYCLCAIFFSRQPLLGLWSVEVQNQLGGPSVALFLAYLRVFMFFPRHAPRLFGCLLKTFLCGDFEHQVVLARANTVPIWAYLHYTFGIGSRSAYLEI